jgi:hypothetical protein
LRYFVILPTISYIYHTESAMMAVSYDMSHQIRAYKP